MHRDKQKQIFWSVRLQFGEAGRGRTPIIMIKSDFDRATFDDSCKLIVLELILLRRLGHHSFEMKAIVKHAATTVNALETTGSTRARELIVMRAKNSLLSHSRSLNEDLFGGGIALFFDFFGGGILFFQHNELLVRKT